MKKLTQKKIESFKKSESVIERLVYAVIQQGLSPESFQDIVNHGINGGFSGFIYYSDTCKFYQENKEDIWELTSEQAQDIGLTELEMIAGFNGAKLAGSADQFENLMSWYAAEEAARYCVDNFELLVE